MATQIDIQEVLDALRKDGPRKVVQHYRRNLLPSRLLLDLYNDYPEYDVQLFLALYPTVPSQILQSLAETVEEEALIAAIAANPRCTQNLLLQLAAEGSPVVRATLAANKLQSQRITSMLLNDPNLFVRYALAKNPAINMHYSAALTADPEPAVREALLEGGKVDDEIAIALTQDASAVVRAQCFAIAKVDPTLLQLWADTDMEEAQLFLLNRTNLAPAVLASLSYSPYEAVRRGAAKQRERTPHELLSIAESGTDAERQELADQEELPEEIQLLLANDPASEVRNTLAANAAITEETALWIAGANDIEMGCALARNPAIPFEVQEKLCHHEAEAVRLQMVHREDLTVQLLNILVHSEESDRIVEHLAISGIGVSGLELDYAKKLVTAKRPSLRAFAATSHHLDGALVQKLARDLSPLVRSTLAQNPILTEEALQELARDWNEEVAKIAQRRLENPKVETIFEQKDATTERTHPDDSEPDEDGLVSRIVRFFK